MQDAMAATGGLESRDRNQEFADDTGLTQLELESSWWGNEKMGEWESRWWARIDHETEKAYHLSAATTGRSEPINGERDRDIWLPKSKAEILTEPNWEAHSPDGEAKGTLTIESPHQTRYGFKADISGDTYDAFKEDGLDEALPWEDTHATWNGSSWEIDATDEAREILIEEATDAGYRIKTLA